MVRALRTCITIKPAVNCFVTMFAFTTVVEMRGFKSALTVVRRIKTIGNCVATTSPAILQTTSDVAGKKRDWTPSPCSCGGDRRSNTSLWGTKIRCFSEVHDEKCPDNVECSMSRLRFHRTLSHFCFRHDYTSTLLLHHWEQRPCTWSWALSEVKAPPPGFLKF